MSPALYPFPDPTLDDPNDPLRPRYRPLEDDAADRDPFANFPPFHEAPPAYGSQAWPTLADLWPQLPSSLTPSGSPHLRAAPLQGDEDEDSSADEHADSSDDAENSPDETPADDAHAPVGNPSAAVASFPHIQRGAIIYYDRNHPDAGTPPLPPDDDPNAPHVSIAGPPPPASYVGPLSPLVGGPPILSPGGVRNIGSDAASAAIVHGEILGAHVSQPAPSIDAPPQSAAPSTSAPTPPDHSSSGSPSDGLPPMRDTPDELSPPPPPASAPPPDSRPPRGIEDPSLAWPAPGPADASPPPWPPSSPAPVAQPQPRAPQFIPPSQDQPDLQPRNALPTIAPQLPQAQDAPAESAYNPYNPPLLLPQTSSASTPAPTADQGSPSTPAVPRSPSFSFAPSPADAPPVDLQRQRLQANPSLAPLAAQQDALTQRTRQQAAQIAQQSGGSTASPAAQQAMQALQAGYQKQLQDLQWQAKQKTDAARNFMERINTQELPPPQKGLFPQVLHGMASTARLANDSFGITQGPLQQLVNKGITRLGGSVKGPAEIQAQWHKPEVAAAFNQAAAEYGLSPQEGRFWLNHYQGHDFTADPRTPVHVLPDGSLALNPATLLDTEQMQQAISAARTSAAEKAAARAALPAQQQQAARALYNTMAQTPDVRGYMDRLPGRTPEEKAMNFARLARTQGGWFSKAAERFHSGSDRVAADALSALRALGIVNQSTVDYWRSRGAAHEASASLMPSGPVSDLVGDAAHLAPSLLAAEAGGRTLGGGFFAASAGGSTFSAAEDAYRRQLQPLVDQGKLTPQQADAQARSRAALPALASAAANAIPFGKFLKLAPQARQQAINAVVQHGLQDYLHRTGQHAGAAALQNATAALTEGLVAFGTYDPRLTPAQIFQRAEESGKLGAILGAGHGGKPEATSHATPGAGTPAFTHPEPSFAHAGPETPGIPAYTGSGGSGYSGPSSQTPGSAPPAPRSGGGAGGGDRQPPGTGLPPPPDEPFGGGASSGDASSSSSNTQNPFSTSQNNGRGPSDTNNPNSTHVRPNQAITGATAGTGPHPGSEQETARDGSEPAASSNSGGQSPADRWQPPPAWATPADRDAMEKRYEENLTKDGLPTNWQLPPGSLPIDTGGEHAVWQSPDLTQVYKITQGGYAGQFPRYEPDPGKSSGGWRLFQGTPDDYEARRNAQNDIFHDNWQRAGSFRDADGFHIVTTQPFHDAMDPQNPHPGESEAPGLIGKYMGDNGFVSIGNKAWYHPGLNVMVADAKPDNFIKTAPDTVKPIDLITRPLGGTNDVESRLLQDLVAKKAAATAQQNQAALPADASTKPLPRAALQPQPSPPPPPNPEDKTGLPAAPLRHGRLPLQTFAKLPDHLPATEAQRYGILRTTLGIYQSHFPALRRRFRKGTTTGRSGLECQFRDPSGRITPQSVHRALIAVHEPKLARDMKGLSPRHCAFHVAHALGEEVRHLASLHAALALWQHSNQHVPFESWLKDHHTRMWQQDFTPQQGYAVLRTYLHHFPSNSPAKSLTVQSHSPSPTSPADWQLALEALRMFSQARAGTLPTESDQLWCTPRPAAAHLRQCLASIQHSATLSRLPPRMEWTLQAMDHLLQHWHVHPAPARQRAA